MTRTRIIRRTIPTKRVKIPNYGSIQIQRQIEVKIKTTLKKR